MSAAEASGAPLVSVLMTAFNREGLLAESVESVLNSTFRDFELVIVDNHSSDDTVAIARGYEREDPRVRVFQNESNIGDFPNRNQAAAYARGTFLKYLDSDDLIYPHGLEVMVRCMETFPEAGLGLAAVPDARGLAPRLLTPQEAYCEHFFHQDLLSRAPGSAIIRRSAFEAVGGFSGRRFIGDVELWLKLAARFPVVKMPTDLVWNREHPGQEQHSQDRIDWIVSREEEEAAALRDASCPLDSELRAKAMDNITRRRPNTYLAMLRGKGGVALAERYRRRVSLSRAAVAGEAWAKVTRLLSVFAGRGTRPQTQ